jgi:hypothetical protein
LGLLLSSSSAQQPLDSLWLRLLGGEPPASRAPASVKERPCAVGPVR